MYMKPNLESLAIIKLPIGSVFTVTGSAGEWHQIETPPDKNGIIIRGFVLQSQTETIGQEEAPDVLPSPVETVPPPSAPPAVAFIPGGQIKFGAGISLGYSIPFNPSHRAAPLIGASFIAIPIEYIALELNGSLCRLKTDQDIETLSEGRILSIEIGLNVTGRYPIKENFIPYISAGGCYAFNSFVLDADLINSWDKLGFDIDESIDNAFGATIGAGLDMIVSKGFSLGMDFKYRWMTASGKWSFKDQLSDVEAGGRIAQLNLNALSLKLGIKYFF